MNQVTQLFSFLQDVSRPPSNPIRIGRIQKEKTLCNQAGVEWSESDYGGDIVKFEILSADGNYVSYGYIFLGPNYPFYQPHVKFELDDQLFSVRNLETYHRYDHYFPKRLWTPKLNVGELVQNCRQYAQSNTLVRNNVRIDDMTTWLFTIRKQTSYLMTSLLVILISLMLRMLMGFGPYSGYNDPPRYGDYEAQRHWMELAVNSPPAEWYRETRLNDPTWWRLDYPPLSGYLAWVLGVLSNLYDPKSVEAYTSRGYETAQHKNFMRWTVLMADLLLLYPILIVLVKTRFSKFNFEYQYSALLMVLACPLLILIDHGHFQYNCVALALSLWGVYQCSEGSIFLGSVLFTCAINFKQMSLYYSLGFFAFILGKLAISSELRPDERLLLNFKRLPHFLGLVMLVGVMVLSTTVLIWLPWLNSIDSIRDVVSAIFPVHRGLYQLKVATFWCISHMVVKWELYFSNEVLVTFSALLTLLSSMPAMACLFINPKLKSFTVGLFIIAQNFFLFGFHVHEKTILLPAIFLMFEIRTFGPLVNDYVTLTCMTLYPLMREDGLALQYFVLLIVYRLIFSRYLKGSKAILLKEVSVPEVQEGLDFHVSVVHVFVKAIHRGIVMKPLIGIFFMLVLTEQIIPPPIRFPYLYPLLYALIGFYGIVLLQLLAYLVLIKQTLKSLIKRKQD